jgi:ABC-type branched-subunit amino acid transport system substrate-binding protein
MATSAAVPAGAQSGENTQGISKTTIKVAGMGDSGAFFSEDSVGLGAKARFARANKDKELPGGRKIQMVAWGDDKSDTATAVAEERRLIQQEGVFAIVPEATIEYQGQLANQTHTPVISLGYDPASCPEGSSKNWYIYSFQGCLVSPAPKYANDHLGIIKAAATKEGFAKAGTEPRTAIISPDNPAGKTTQANWTVAAQKNGMNVVYSRASTPAPPAVVGDYSPYVQALLATKPDIIISLGTSADYIGLGKALQAANFKGMFLIPIYSPQLAAGVGPHYAETQSGTPESTAPAMQQIKKDLEAYKSGTKPDTLNTYGWLQAEMFIQAMKKAGKNPTGEKVQQILQHFTYEVPGVVGPYTYPGAFTSAGINACHEIVKWDGTQYTIVEPYQCSSKKWPAKSYDSTATG